MTTFNKKASSILSELPIESLVEQWDLVSVMETTQEVANPRGRLLDAIEAKNPTGIGHFYEGFYEDSELRNFVL